MISAPFSYTRQARSLTTALVVAAVWAALVAVWALWDASGWIVAFVAVFTLPALWDLATNPASGLTLDADGLRWHSGRRRAEVALDEIEHVRLDTRLDFTVRATVVLKTGRKLRLPFEATPPSTGFEAALEARGITTRRFHFQLLQ